MHHTQSCDRPTLLPHRLSAPRSAAADPALRDHELRRPRTRNLDHRIIAGTEQTAPLEQRVSAFVHVTVRYLFHRSRRIHRVARSVLHRYLDRVGLRCIAGQPVICRRLRERVKTLCLQPVQHADILSAAGGIRQRLPCAVFIFSAGKSAQIGRLFLFCVYIQHGFAALVQKTCLRKLALQQRIPAAAQHTGAQPPAVPQHSRSPPAESAYPAFPANPLCAFLHLQNSIFTLFYIFHPVDTCISIYT